MVFAAGPALQRTASLFVDPQRPLGSLGSVGSMGCFFRKGVGAAADSLGRIGDCDLVLGGSLVPRPIRLLPLKLADIGNRHCVNYGQRGLGAQPDSRTQLLSGEW